MESEGNQLENVQNHQCVTNWRNQQQGNQSDDATTTNCFGKNPK